jgi:hypothetical protein
MCQTYSAPLTGGASNRVSVVWLFAIKAFILIYCYYYYYYHHHHHHYYNNCTNSYISHSILWHICVCILHRQWRRRQGTTVRMASLTGHVINA